MLSQKFPKINYDVLIIGGGINGAAIAHLAALTGARVALVEKNDWASGTSSKSTKLLHGGIRYLENLEFDLVAESLKERFIQYKSVPHLVRPMQFIIPVYKGQGRPLWMMQLGVWLYDLLSGRYSLGGHEKLTREEIIRRSPGIKQEGLVGGVSYFDAQMDDARIVIENVLEAKKHGADVSNYTEVVEFLKENGRVFGAQVRDVMTGEQCAIKAEKVIVAAGPWADILRHKDVPTSQARLRPTKGVHIICPGSLGNNAFLLQNRKDNRVFFAIPFNGNTLIGTTDTDYQGPVGPVTADESDINYLLEQASDVFPGAHFKREEIITSFAGLRPLVKDAGSPSQISRQHVIERSLAGIVYVMGGKYTTYRAIALEAIKKVLPKFARKLPNTETYSIYGSGLKTQDVKVLALQHGLDAHTIDHLIHCYGSRFEDVLDLIGKDSSLRAKLCSCSPAIRAQVVYSCQVELARSADDIFERRLGLVYNECQTQQCKQTIEAMLKESTKE